MSRSLFVLLTVVLAGGVAAGLIGGTMACLIRGIQFLAGEADVLHPVPAAGVGGVLAGSGPDTVALASLLGAAMVLAVMQRTPLFAAVIAWELTWAPWWALPLLLAGAGAAHLLGRGVGKQWARA